MLDNDPNAQEIKKATETDLGKLLAKAGTASTAIRMSLPRLTLHLDGFHLCAALRMPWSFVNAVS